MSQAGFQSDAKNSEYQSRLLAVLNQYWGYEEFRPLQAEAMGAVLSDRDSVVVLPTGGGKSLCFQAPAACRQQFAVVVSPLISLMKDQVDSLVSCGIAAACLNSSMTPGQRRMVFDQIRDGELSLLYIAPERLLTEQMLGFLDGCHVGFFAIDEAHCISAWGHDFRPEYRDLQLLKTRYPSIAVHAYTATATEQVRRDIAVQLGLRNPQILVGSFDRENLVYKVERRDDVISQIQSIVQRHAGSSGVIYCISRKEVEKTSDALNSLGFCTRPYHAGLTDVERHENQEAFINEQIDTIVATVAFGMGIDKSNVRYVIHAGMPKSLEAYQQESGRAGRDGLEAECTLFYSPADFMVWKKMLEREPSAATDGAIESLQAMSAYATGVRCRHAALTEYFGQNYERDSCDACDVCCGQLDEVDEPLIIGQKILSCVVRVGQRFGGDYVSLVLNGSRDQRIIGNRHDELSTYGIMTGESRKAIRDWIEQLVGQQFLEKSGDYNVLGVTESGWQVLRGDLVPRLLKSVEPKSGPKSRRRGRTSSAHEDGWDGVDRDLFDSLRLLRREQATRESVPAYIIFSDATLRDMARRRPTTLEQFKQVHGVGEKKSRDYGQVFMEHVERYCRQHDVEANMAT